MQPWFSDDLNLEGRGANSGMRHGSQLSLYMLGRLSSLLYQLLASADENLKTESDRKRFILFNIYH
jgi:hypothetical protein